MRASSAQAAARAQLARRRLIMALGAALAIAVAATTALHTFWPTANGAASTAASQQSQSTKTSAAKEQTASQSKSQTTAERALQSIGKLDDSAQISTVGFDLDTSSQMQLEQALSTLESAGYTTSVVLVDMQTGNALGSYAGSAVYSASTIKAPYILSLAETGTIDLQAVVAGSTDADTQTQSNIDQAITMSSNDAYAALRKTYGADAFAKWASAVGMNVDVSDETLGYYLDISAADMARAWAQGYGYLFEDDSSDDASAADTDDSADSADTDTDARAWLANEFANTYGSVIRPALSENDTVYSKPGWINGEGGLYSLSDAGVVHTDSGDYVLAVMTDAAGEYDLLYNLIATLDQIRTDVMGS
ncbi:serine hydrolase [Bifidobacterium sp. LC6]|uniref:Serine hydrolase n=1 Tax=Bifidobacterium colobi TaxID=2809026 RepID=A0ABS5UU15_9BIFI|nr:serine hydrolase [Bifidobacterium colobi]MBT1174266.1 serine hydrolase [Bifidobacterium colobi]